VGSFWALGFGNPSRFDGHDNGTWGLANWTYPYAGNQILLGTWSQSGEIDGCIEGKIAPGKSREIMVAEFSDVGSGAYFAVAAVGRDAGNWIQFDFSAVGPDITLAPIRGPEILASFRSGPHTLQISVAGPSASQLAAGFFSDGSVSLSEVIVGYRIYETRLGYRQPGPGPLREDGWQPLTGTVPIGQTIDVHLECTRHYENLALSLVFESGYESVYLARHSAIIACEMCLGDDDHDGVVDSPDCGAVDCDDADAQTYPGGLEINDGKDNQCPGDAGFGLVDEVDGAMGFKTPGDKNTLSWPAQSGATGYQVGRSGDPGFATGCTSFLSSTPSITDPGSPPANLGFYYLLRATTPLTGSWGATSAGAPRSTVCP
jgi:hypothetical protein